MMNLYKFCSNGLTSFAFYGSILLIVGCSGTPVRELTEESLLKTRQIQRIHKGTLLDAYFHDQAVALAVSTAKGDPSDGVFRAYCQSGKQVRALTYRITVVSPSAPKGIPIDRAAKIASTAASQLQWVARNFFRTIERPESEAKDSDFAFQRDYPAIGGGGLEGLTKKAVSLTATDEIRYTRLSEEGPAIEYVFIGSDGDKILLADRRVLGEEQRYGSYVVESELKLRERPMQVQLARAFPGEWAYISQFALLPPEEELRAWIRHRDRTEESDPADAYHGLEHPDALYDENGRIVIEEAVKHASDLWSLYTLRYASSKLATQQDGSTIVELSLDLSGFCGFARSRAMLLSK